MSKVKAIPDGLTAVTAHLVADGTAPAIEWYGTRTAEQARQ